MQKLLVALFISFPIFCCEHPELNRYISAQRREALADIQRDFGISDEQWSSVTHILSSVYARQKEMTFNPGLWGQQAHQAVEHEFGLAPSTKIVYRAIIDAFVRKNIQPFDLTFAASIPETEKKFTVLIYDSITDQDRKLRPASLQEFAACVATKNFCQRALIAVDPEKLRRLDPIGIEIVMDHEVGHYAKCDGLTKSLIKKLLERNGLTQEQIEQTRAWQSLIKTTKEEADDFAINNDPLKIALHNQYNLKPGEWTF